jgi:predicted RecA/RadA family phage recombinase
MVHPTHSDGLVDHGDPVVVNRLVGVALKDAAAATDEIAIDTEGIWDLNVLGAIADGTADGVAHQLNVGDPIYINKTTGVLSGISDPGTHVPFGIALSVVASGAATLTLTAVKVHQMMDNEQMLNNPDLAPSGGSAGGFSNGSPAGAMTNKLSVFVNGVQFYIPIYAAT